MDHSTASTSGTRGCSRPQVVPSALAGKALITHFIHCETEGLKGPRTSSWEMGLGLTLDGLLTPGLGPFLPSHPGPCGEKPT